MSVSTLTVGDRRYEMYRLDSLGIDVSRLPYSLRILLENLLRHEDDVVVTRDDVESLARWEPGTASDREIAFTPARVLLQDFTGVPLLVDLAAMRSAMKRLGKDPRRVEPRVPVCRSRFATTSGNSKWIGSGPAASSAIPGWSHWAS